MCEMMTSGIRAADAEDLVDTEDDIDGGGDENSNDNDDNGSGEMLPDQDGSDDFMNIDEDDDDDYMEEGDRESVSTNDNEVEIAIKFYPDACDNCHRFSERRTSNRFGLYDKQRVWFNVVWLTKGAFG